MAEDREMTGTLGGLRIRATVERIGSTIHGYATMPAVEASRFLDLRLPNVTYLGPVIQEDGSVKDEKVVVKFLDHKKIRSDVGAADEVSVAFRG
jgi:hypothetical protein